MITELQKGMLLGYLSNAPLEIKDIAMTLISEETEKRRLDKVMDSLVSDCLELSIRSVRAIKENNIKTIRELVSLSEWEMLSTPGFGRKGLNEIKEELTKKGLRFGWRG